MSRSEKPRVDLAAWGAFVEGYHRLLEGDARGALAPFERALERDPLFGEAHHNLACALRSLGHRRTARVHARQARRWMPGVAAPTILLGTLDWLEGELEDAIRNFRKALDHEPDERVAHAALAVALQLTGQTTRAHEHFEAALDPARDAPPLPALLEERVRGQQRDALLTELQSAPHLELCTVPIVTQLCAPAPMERAEDTAVEVARWEDAPQPTEGRIEIGAEEAAALIAGRRVVALTGAGISSASGLQTRKEMWRIYDKDEAVSIWRFEENPAYLWEVVRDFWARPAEPNAAHRALARMEEVVCTLTQNVDRLHQAAGAERVIELHGDLHRCRCASCGRGDRRTVRQLLERSDTLPPRCAGSSRAPSCQGALRPSVVLFGEAVPRNTLRVAMQEALTCDVMLVVGCAMDVAPASELPRMAARAGATVIELNVGPTRLSDAIGARLLRGPAEETLPALLEALRALST